MSGKKPFQLTAWMILVLGLAVGLAGFRASPALGSVRTAVYTAPDGFQVVSYSAAWSEVLKLQDVYTELLRNTHGEEFRLLNRVVIYPEASPDDPEASGRWFGLWSADQERLRVAGNRYIEIYNGDKFNTIEDIAKTLAHEYGHHFTYYYYYKKENRLWDNWRETELADARGLKRHPKVRADGAEHKWLIQEIAAEDYVQLFGSPTAKRSVDFPDLEEQLVQNRMGMTMISSDIYNYQPQENYEIPLAANIKGLKEYWLKAAGLGDRTGSPPAQVNLELQQVNQIPGYELRQYIFGWEKSTDDKTANLEYTLNCFGIMADGSQSFFPVKTVSGGEALTAVFGSTRNSDYVVWEPVPKLGYFLVHVQDGDGLVTSSRVLAVDFSNPNAPQTVLLDDQSLSDGSWFPPRVKVNGKQLAFDVPPVIQDGRTLVPLRTIFEELGATVEWEAGTQTIKARRGETELSLQVGNHEATVNGQRVILEVPPRLQKGRTLVPLRFVSEALGAEVEWNQVLQLAIIVK